MAVAVIRRVVDPEHGSFWESVDAATGAQIAADTSAYICWETTRCRGYMDIRDTWSEKNPIKEEAP